MGRRPERLAEGIREEVARIVSSELKDPRLGFITITRVEVTHDLGLARVLVSVLGDEAERQRSMAALQQRDRVRPPRDRPAAAHPRRARDRVPLRQGHRRDRSRRPAARGGAPAGDGGDGAAALEQNRAPGSDEERAADERRGTPTKTQDDEPTGSR